MRICVALAGGCQGCRAHSVYLESVCQRFSGDPGASQTTLSQALALALPAQELVFRTHGLALLSDLGRWKELRNEASMLLETTNPRRDKVISGYVLMNLAESYARLPATSGELKLGRRRLKEAQKRFEHAERDLLFTNLAWLAALLAAAEGDSGRAIRELRDVRGRLSRMGDAARAEVAELDRRAVQALCSADPWAELTLMPAWPWAEALKASAARGHEALLATVVQCRAALENKITGWIPAFPLGIIPMG